MNQEQLSWHVAAAEALSTLYMAHRRLEMNNYNGEETEYMNDIMNAADLLAALPIQNAVVLQWHKKQRGKSSG